MSISFAFRRRLKAMKHRNGLKDAAPSTEKSFYEVIQSGIDRCRAWKDREFRL